MIAKILQWCPTRYMAATRMRQVLDECVIEGQPNNLNLIRQFIATRTFFEGRTFTTTLEKYAKENFFSSPYISTKDTKKY